MRLAASSGSAAIIALRRADSTVARSSAVASRAHPRQAAASTSAKPTDFLRASAVQQNRWRFLKLTVNFTTISWGGLPCATRSAGFNNAQDRRVMLGAAPPHAAAKRILVVEDNE